MSKSMMTKTHSHRKRDFRVYETVKRPSAADRSGAGRPAATALQHGVQQQMQIASRDEAEHGLVVLMQR